MAHLKTIPISALSRDDCYRLSFPLQPGKYGEIAKRLPGMPLLVVDRQKRIVSSHDFVSYLKKKGEKKVAALQAELPEKEALFFAFHWKHVLVGFNLYEKLIFIKKALFLTTPADIQHRTPLGIPITDALVTNLDRFILSPWKTLLMAEKISLRTLLRLAPASRKDRQAISRLLQSVNFNDNQQQKIVEMLEEIAFRDHLSWQEALDRISISTLTSKEMPQKAIIEALFHLRFPAYRRFFKEWQAHYHHLFAAMNIRVTPHPFFEKQELELNLRCANLEEAQKILEMLKNKAGR